MSSSGPVIIYRFDSPCGRYCYVGQTQNLQARIQQHRSETGDTAIARHCQECEQCNRARQYHASRSWPKRFTQLGSATGKKQVDDLEHRYIEVACEDYIRDHNNPFPLNLRAEVGSGILLHAARNLYEIRMTLEEETFRIGPLQANLQSAEQERDSLKQKFVEVKKERVEERRVRNSLTRERDTLKEERDSTRRNLRKLREEWDGLERKLVAVEKERNKERRARISLTNEHDTLKRERDNTGEERDELRNKLKSARQMLGKARKERDQYRDERDALKEERGRLRQERDEAGLAREKLDDKYWKLKDQWNREKDSIRAGKLVTVLFRFARLALIPVLIIVLAVLLNSGSRAWLGRVAGRVGPALALLLEDPLRSGASVQPAEMRQSPATIPLQVTPRSTSTSAPTRMPTSTVSPLSEPAPQQLVVVETVGANARACPRMECEVLAKLVRGSQTNVMDEVRGETYRDSALWYRIALSDSFEEAFVHSSLLGPPLTAPDG